MLTETKSGVWRIATLLGILLAVLAISFPIVGWLAIPGWLFAWPIYPEGVHTRSGSGIGLVVMIFLGTAVFWSFMAALVLFTLRRLRNRARVRHAA